MASFVSNQPPEVLERARKIDEANREWKSMRERFDFSWAVKLGYREPEGRKLKPSPNDYCRHWGVYAEAF
eukprot:9160504-Alexandrium_andersonii.AAC.1